MLAAQLSGPLALSLNEVAVPEPAAGELLIRVRAASICGTDVRMYKNGKAGVATPEHPLTLGHEFAGVIEQVGAGVVGYEPGQHVAIAPNFGCGTCDLCVCGQTNACKDFGAIGVSVPGAFAEFVLIPAPAVAQGNVMVLSGATDFAEAALVEPLSCVYNGQMRMGAAPGSDILIIGAGPIGIMHALLARQLGAARIFMNDLNVERLEEACALAGAIPITGDVTEGLKNATGSGVDACIVACPAPAAQTASLGYMNTNGRVLFFGGLPKGKEVVPLDTNVLHYRQLSVFGCTGQSLTDYRTCAKLVDAGAIDLSGIVSTRRPLTEFEAALDDAVATRGLKHAIVFDA